MRHRIVLLAPFLVAAAPALAADSLKESDDAILELIQRNYSGETTRSLADRKGNLMDSRIWIHIRSDAQQEEAQKIQDLLEGGIHLGPVTRGVDLRPVQEVEVGPSSTQVRYFRREDQATAHEIARTLSDAGIPASSESFVERFKDASYIDIGHIEIWLTDAPAPEE